MVSWKIMDTKTLNTYFHNKVLILNIILTFIIVLLHSQPLNRIGISTDDNYPLVHGVGVFAQVGVPMFFFYFCNAVLQKYFSDVEDKG